MIAHKEIKQQTEDWYRIKYGKIGGTRASQLYVKSDTLFIELLSEKTEDFNDTELSDFFNKDMIRGNDLEPEARNMAKQLTGYDFKEFGWLQHESIEILGLSPDGLTNDYKVACEIKCPKRKRHAETFLSDEIPLDNIAQLVHYFTVNENLEKLFFISYRPENLVCPFYSKELTRNSIVNMGTKSKPNLKTIQEFVSISFEEINKLEQKLNESVQSLNKF